MLNEKLFSEEPLVTLIAASKSTSHSSFGPEQLSAYGALGCFEEKSTVQIYEGVEESARAKKEEIVLRESAGRGHGSVADQATFTFSVENLTRAATLQLCLPQYLAHLQQSLRRATADRAFYLPPAIRESPLYEEAKKVLSEAFETYTMLGEKGIPLEDARFLLPLYTKTNIQTSGDARELMHLSSMNKQGELPSAVKNVVKGMIAQANATAPNLFRDYGYNYETLAWYPSAQLYSSENTTANQIIAKLGSPSKTTYFEHDVTEAAVCKAVKERNETELSNLKHVHNGGKLEGFLLPMSIACFHQAIRQRTWDHSVESIYDAAKRNNAIVPPSIETSAFKDKYMEQHNRMMKLYEDLVKSGVPRSEAIGVVPHSLQLYDLIHVNGWNSLHSIGKRTCTEAQWEIRALANQIAGTLRERNPALGKFIFPQGVIYGKCPERKPCGLCDKMKEAF